MVSKRIILLFMIGIFMQTPLWAQIQPEEAEMLDEEIDGEEDILLEDMDAGQGEDMDEALWEEGINDEEESAPEDQVSTEEGNKGYIYGSSSTEETQKPPRKPMSLWQRIIKIDEWFQEKFW